jgi:group I intron endonuclease
MRHGIIYRIINKIDGKIYIGKTTRTLETRWYQHQRHESYCVYLKNAIAKYGKDAFIVEEILSVFDANSLEYYEEYLIDYHDCLAPKGYNLKRGGKNGTFSEISKEKCRIAQQKNWEAPGRKDYYSEFMSKQWADDPELSATRLAPIYDYINNKRIPIISVCMSSGEVTRYPSYNHTPNPNDVHVAVKQQAYAHNRLWYIDNGESDDEILARALLKLKRWQPENIYPIVAEDLNTGKCTEYATIQDAKQEGFDISSIRKCLAGSLRQTGGCRWQLKSQFTPTGPKKLPTTNGRSVRATNLQTGEVLEFITALAAKASGFHNSRIGEAIKLSKPYKGHKWEFI